MSGSLGETHFVQQQINSNIFLRNKAVRSVIQNEIAEWYRIQYNIPLHTFQSLEIPEDVMYEDFYRRQYYEEIRLSIRKYNDDDSDFKMPPFSMFRPYGGAMPVPNGFGVNTNYSYDINNASKEASQSESPQVTLNEDGSYTIEDFRGSGIPNEIHDKQRTEYQGDAAEFDDLLSRTDDDSMWEELEKIIPGE